MKCVCQSGQAQFRAGNGVREDGIMMVGVSFKKWESSVALGMVVCTMGLKRIVVGSVQYIFVTVNRMTRFCALQYVH